MERRIWTWAIACVLAWAGPAAAEQAAVGHPPAEEPGERETKEPSSPVVDMSEDVAFERPIGLYVEGRGGVFFTVGGRRGYSNGQPFVGFEVGYDIDDAWSIQLGYASGYQAANQVEEHEPPGDYHLDFGVTFFNLSADYDVWCSRRWALELRFGGGVVLIDPSAVSGQGPVDGDVFAGVRFEYHTLLEHFTLGAEYDFFFVLPTNIPAMALSASVIYHF